MVNDDLIKPCNGLMMVMMKTLMSGSSANDKMVKMVKREIVAEKGGAPGGVVFFFGVHFCFCFLHVDMMLLLFEGLPYLVAEIPKWGFEFLGYFKTGQRKGYISKWGLNFPRIFQIRTSGRPFLSLLRPILLLFFSLISKMAFKGFFL